MSTTIFLEGTSEVVALGFFILLVSILLALLAAVVLSIALSYSFTRPLSKMKATALHLSMLLLQKQWHE